MISNTEIKKVFAPIWEDVKDVWTRDIFRDVFRHYKNQFDAPEDSINHSLYFEAKTFLHSLLIVEDKLSMAHSMETRVPFMDNDLVDFAMKCPVKLKLNNLNTLDLACGNGANLMYLKKKFDNKKYCLGLDFNKLILNSAKQFNTYENLDLKYGNILNLKDMNFSLVWKVGEKIYILVNLLGLL